MRNSSRKTLSAICVVSIAVFALLFFWSALMVVTFRIPQTGASATCDDIACWKIVEVQRNTAAARAGLRVDDVVVDASPCPPGLFACSPFRLFSGNPVPRFELAHPLTLSVTRGARHFYVSLDPSTGSRSYPIGDALTFIFRLLVYTGFIVLGTWLVLLRPGLMTSAFFTVCVSLAAPSGLAMLTYIEVFQHGTPLDRLFNISMAFQLGITALPVFLLRFPNDNSTGLRGRMLITALWAVPCLYLLAFLLDGYDYLPELKIAILLISLGILAATYARAPAATRKRLQWAMVGITAAIMASLMLNAITGISLYVFHWQPIGVLDRSSLARNVILDLAGLLYALMLICITYAIIRHRVIDVRFIANRGIVIGSMLLLFAAAFAGLDWLFSAYVYQSQAQIAIGIAAAFALGWAIRSWWTHFVDLVDRVFFPKYHAGVTQMRELRLVLEREDSHDSVRRILTADAAASLQLASAAIFARTSDGGFIRETAQGWGPGTVWHLLNDDLIVSGVSAHRGKPFRVEDSMWGEMAVPAELASPTLAVPLTSRRGVVALLLYGAHTNGAAIDPDETRLLTELGAAAAPSFDQRETSGILAKPAFAAEATRTAR